MHRRTRLRIWFVALLLMAVALLGSCGGATSSLVPEATGTAPVHVPATSVPTAVTAPTDVPDLITPATDAPSVTDVPQAPTETAPVTEEPPSIDAVALLEARCVDCHSLSRTTGARYTQEQWQQVVTRMIRHGAVLNPDEETALVAYLAETYKP